MFLTCEGDQKDITERFALVGESSSKSDADEATEYWLCEPCVGWCHERFPCSTPLSVVEENKKAKTSPKSGRLMQQILTGAVLSRVPLLN